MQYIVLSGVNSISIKLFLSKFLQTPLPPLLRGIWLRLSYAKKYMILKDGGLSNP